MSTIQIAQDTVLAMTAKQEAFIKKLIAEVASKIEGKTSYQATSAKTQTELIARKVAEMSINKRTASKVIELLIQFNNTNYDALEAQVVERANRVEAPIGVYKHNEEIYRVIKGRNSKNLYAQKLVVIEGRDPRWEYAGGKIYQLKVEELISPEVAAQMGRARGFCVICGRYLTDATSVERGIGPVCYERTSAAYRNHPINN